MDNLSKEDTQNFLQYCDTGNIEYLLRIKINTLGADLLRSLSKQTLLKYNYENISYTRAGSDTLAALPPYPNIQQDLISKQDNPTLYNDIVKEVGNITLFDDPRKKSEIRSITNVYNMPKTLNKQKFIDDVASDTRMIWITDKMDGERCLLDILDGKGIYITSKGYGYIYIDTPHKNRLILDCELYNGDFYVFDIILATDFSCEIKRSGQIVKEICCSSCPVKYRLELVDKLFSFNTFRDQAPRRPMIFKKQILEYNMRSGGGEFMRVNRRNLDVVLGKKPYPTDGIIFIMYNEPTFNKKFNRLMYSINTYKNTLNYKWKPAESLSIDFLCVRIPAELEAMLKMKNGYILCSKSNRQIENTLPAYNSQEDIVNKLVRYVMNSDVLRNVENDAPHAPFMPSTKPLAFLYSHDPVKSGIDDLNNLVAEMRYERGGGWVFMRVRYDKSHGNNFYGAEEIWQQYFNPLTVGDLYKTKTEILQGRYFKKALDARMEKVRNYNNYIKMRLISAFAGHTDFALDLGSGKGQDLAKYNRAGVRNLVMTENDLDAVDEIIKRKQENFSMETKLFVSAIDLRSDRKTIASSINSLFKYGSLTHKCNSIISNLAFHYLADTMTNMNNIASVIDYFLTKSGGFFVFSAFDGKRVYDLTKDGAWNPDEAFFIEQVNSSLPWKPFTNKIRVKLPCDDQVKEEVLLDLNILDRVLGKYGLKRFITQRFTEVFVDSEEYNVMDELDREFAGLYQYVVYGRDDSSIDSLLYKKASEWSSILNKQVKKCVKINDYVVGIEYNKYLSDHIGIYRLSNRTRIIDELPSKNTNYSYILTKNSVSGSGSRGEPYYLYLVEEMPGEIGMKHFIILYAIPPEQVIVAAGEMHIDTVKNNMEFNLKSGSIMTNLFTVGKIFGRDLNYFLQKFITDTNDIFNNDENRNHFNVRIDDNPIVKDLEIIESDIRRFCDLFPSGIRIKKFDSQFDCDKKFNYTGTDLCKELTR